MSTEDSKKDLDHTIDSRMSKLVVIDTTSLSLCPQKYPKTNKGQYKVEPTGNNRVLSSALVKDYNLYERFNHETA